MPEVKLKSIRVSLLIVTLLIFIPLLVIILYSSHLQKEKSYQQATDKVLAIAHHLSEQQKILEANTSQFLQVLSQLPELKSNDTCLLNSLLRSLLKSNPIYASLLLTDSKGNVIASGTHYTALNVSDRKYFRDAVVNKSFSVGEFTKGRISQRAVIHYAFPVLDNKKNIISVLVTSFDLMYYYDFLRVVNIRDDISYIITDHKDVVLYNSLDQSLENVGTAILNPQPAISGVEEGTFILNGKDRIKRLYGFQKLGLTKSESYINVYVGIPAKIAFEEYSRIIFNNILLWLITIVAVIGLAYFFSLKYIIDPIDRLVTIADSIAEGNLSIKPQTGNSSSELNKLSMAFNSMVDRLSQREMERRKVEKDLKKLKERFELAINTAKIGIWDWHIRTDFLIWDKNMLELYGTESLTFENNLENWKKYIHPEDLAGFEKNIEVALKLHQPFRNEFRIIHPNTGIKSIRIFASVIEDKEGNPVRLIGVNWDISERKILENKLNEAKENAEQNVRLKSVFFADISHEIRTPLHGIIGFAQILKNNETSYQEQLQYLDIIVNNGNKLLTVISDIIDISLIDAGQMKMMKKECNINSLVYNIFDYYNKLRIKEKKQFNLKLTLDAPILAFIDTFRFNQIFSNLINHVCKFNENGEIVIGCKVVDEELCCFVKDFGTGLDKGQLIRIFDALRKNDDLSGTNYSENGLGLIVCKGLVELMGGTIWANCEDGVTEFYFNIPIQQTELPRKNHQYKSDLIT